jgi:lipopolysaccharide export system protein LptA
MFKLKNKKLLCGVLLLLASPCWAEKADREKPMHVEADQVVVDDAKQISVFTGNVQLSQGTMLMRGDKVVVTQDKAGNQHVTVTGNLASFRQKREGLEEYVEGYGQRIEHDTAAQVVDFYEQAQMKRELDDVRGEHITYSTVTEVFKVFSGTSPVGTTALPKRVHAVLQPKKDKQKTATPSALPIRPSPDLSRTE